VPGTLSGTLVFSGSPDLDAGLSELHQLYAIDLGASQPAITPLSVTPNRGAWMPFFSHDGTQLFFTQVDQDPASPTNGQLLLVTAHPDGSSPTTITSCGASTGGNWRGPFCGWPAVGADGDVWYLLENKPPVVTFGQQVLRVPPTGGAMPTTWLDFPSDPTCAIYSMALSPDGTKIAFIIGDSSACGTGRDGLYVQPISSSTLGTPLTPGSTLDTTYTTLFTAFNRAGDRVYYIGTNGELYSEKLDGTDSRVEVNADLSLLGSTGIGMTIVNDAYVVLSGAPGGIGAVPFASVSPSGQFFVIAPAFAAENVTWAP
jgi:Tol biopolymer transport system component